MYDFFFISIYFFILISKLSVQIEIGVVFCQHTNNSDLYSFTPKGFGLESNFYLAQNDLFNDLGNTHT